MSKRKPTRGDLLIVIGRMQQLFGQALGVAYNDRDPNRLENLVKPLDAGQALALEALAQDPPQDGKASPWQE